MKLSALLTNRDVMQRILSFASKKTGVKMGKLVKSMDDVERLYSCNNAVMDKSIDLLL